jgi:excisionase family DNA binding protein
MDARTDPTPSETAEVLLTASQVARRLSVSRNWVYQAVEAGLLPYRRLGPGGPIRFVCQGRLNSGPVAPVEKWTTLR